MDLTAFTLLPKCPAHAFVEGDPFFWGVMLGGLRGSSLQRPKGPVCFFLRKSVRHTLSLLKGLSGGSASSGQLLFFLSEPLAKVCTATPLAFSLHHAFLKQCLNASFFPLFFFFLLALPRISPIIYSWFLLFLMFSLNESLSPSILRAAARRNQGTLSKLCLEISSDIYLWWPLISSTFHLTAGCNSAKHSDTLEIPQPFSGFLITCSSLLRGPSLSETSKSGILLKVR